MNRRLSCSPPSGCIDPTSTSNGSWSIHGRLLPYLEQGNLYDRIDLSISWSNQPIISRFRVPVYFVHQIHEVINFATPVPPEVVIFFVSN
ncbi:MAG: DUF1559 domain-containing protein [Pirellulales bacterium]